MRTLVLIVAPAAALACCWLVRREGAAYRDWYTSRPVAELERRLVTSEPDAAGPTLPIDPAVASAATAYVGMAGRVPRPATSAGTTLLFPRMPDPPADPVEAPGPEDDPTIASAPTSQADPAPEPAAEPTSAPPPPPAPEPPPSPTPTEPAMPRFEPRLAGEVAVSNAPGPLPAFDSDRPATMLDADGRRQLGQAVHALVVDTLPVFRGGELHDRLERLAAPLGTATGREGDDPPRLFLIDSDDVFAFAHVGNYLYVSRGVFALAASDAELQFVLAHERAHLDQGHALAAIDREGGAPIGEASTAERAFARLAEGYPPDEERQADDRAFNALIGLKRTRRECLGFLLRLKKYAEARGLGMDPAGPGPAGPPDFESAYAPAPVVSSRLEHLMQRPTAGSTRPQ